MHVVLLTNNRLPPREGIGQHVMALGRGLAARGHRVTLVARGERLRGWQALAVEELPLRRYPWCPLPPLHHVLARQSLGRWLARGADGADLLHVHLPLLPPLPTDLPVVVTVHSPMLADSAAISERGLKPALLRAQARLVSRRFEAAWLGRARRVIAVSHGVCHELETGYGLARGRVGVVPNGVDATFFTPDPEAWPDDPVSLLYVGRLAVRKGLFRLLDAFAALAAPGLHLRLVGEGPLEPALRQRATALGVADRVRFSGFLDREGVREALRGAAAFVNPADYESGPLTLLEAMACGTPVISTPTGLARELGPTPPVLLAEPSVQGLVAAIHTLRRDPAAASARAGRAISLVRDRYGWERVVDGVEAAYGLERRCAA